MKMKHHHAVAAAGALGSTGVPPVPAGVPPDGSRGVIFHRPANARRCVGDSAGRRAGQAGRLCYPSRGSAPLAGVTLLALLLGLSAHAEDKAAAVTGVTGVKQDAIDRVAGVKQDAIPQVKAVTQTPPPPPPAVPPPPPTSVEIKPVTQTPPPPPPTAVEIRPISETPPPPPPTAVDIKPVSETPPPPPPTGVEIKPVTQTPPPPPPAVNKIEGVHTPPPPPPVSAVNHVGSIQAVNGVTGLNTAKLQNLESALILKQAAETPKGDDAEHSGKGKAAAAALLAAPLDKAPPKPKEDGRAGFHEFEKLQNRGS